MQLQQPSSSGQGPADSEMRMSNDVEAPGALELTSTHGEKEYQTLGHHDSLVATAATSEGEKEADYKLTQRIMTYLCSKYPAKFFGVEGKAGPKLNGPLHVAWSSILAFIGIFLVAVIDRWFLTRQFEADERDVAMLTGAQAATAVLLYEAFQSPLAQPRNVIGSYVFCSFTGVTVRIICMDLIGIQRWVTGAIAVGCAIAVMNLTKTIHPPGGACALIAVIGGDNIRALGYGYMATSFGASFTMVCVALLGNNLALDRQYPLYWIG